MPIANDPFSTYSTKILAIHDAMNNTNHNPTITYKNIDSLDAVLRMEQPNLEENNINETLRSYEFKALVDSFLGQGYDQEKVSKLEALQIEAWKCRDRLIATYSKNEINAAAYLQNMKGLISDVFQKAEEILGTNDYLRLFGDENGNCVDDFYIDQDRFIREDEERFQSHSDSNLDSNENFQFQDILPSELIPTAHFIFSLKDSGILLSKRGGGLRFHAPSGALTQELREQIATNKEQILEVLTLLGDRMPFRGEAI